MSEPWALWARRVAISDVINDVSSATTAIAVVRWNELAGVASVVVVKWNAPIVPADIKYQPITFGPFRDILNEMPSAILNFHEMENVIG